MATTESRSGFRLPWSSDQSTSPDPSATGDSDVVAVMGDENGSTADPGAAPSATSEDRPVATESEATAEASPSEPEAGMPPVDPKTPGGRRPVKFLADLAKAMQSAAESARAATVEQYRTDGKVFIEQIHARSADESASIRRHADEDVAAIREWSKAEIARIREEADQRTARRKAHLETQIERHAALIEREIEKVQARINDFEGEMERFFDALLREEDPTKIAALAASLPEPEPFEEIDDRALQDLLADPEVVSASTTATTLEEAVEAMPEQAAEDLAVADVAASEPDGEDAPVTVGTLDLSGTQDVTADGDSSDAELARAELIGVEADANVAPAVETSGDEDRPVSAEEAMAAIEARARAAELAEAEAEAAATADASSAEATPSGSEPQSDADPDSIVEIGEESLAARLAGLVPTTGSAAPQAQAAASNTTQVVVVGLVSVASIAGFKRQLGRLPGVQSVGVSSGPDGEFIFAVAHGADQALGDQITSLPGFQATITGAGESVINVTAHDPEA